MSPLTGLPSTRTREADATRTRATRQQELLDVIGKDGKCAGQVPHDWFVTGGLNYVALHNRGLMVCQLCPVKDECLEYAEVAGEGDGVWGGVELGRSVDSKRVRREGAELRRRQFRARAVRWLANVRFEERRGRKPGRPASDGELVARLMRDVEADLEAGRLPLELLDDAENWDVIGPQIVGDDDDELPAEFVEAVEAVWREAS